MNIIEIFLKTSGIISAFLLPLLAGYPIAVLFFSKQKSVITALLVSFLIGSSFLTLLFFLGNMLLGIPVSLFSGLIYLCFIWLAGTYIQKIALKLSQMFSDANNGKTIELLIPKGENSILFSGVSMSVVIMWFLLIGAVAMSMGIYSIPGVGVWGYKAMIIAKQHTIPLSIFTDPTKLFIHHSYPLGYPLFISWCYFFLGGIDDYFIKIVPLILGILIYLQLFAISRAEGFSFHLASLLPLTICGGITFVTCSTTLYADLLLMLYIGIGCYLLFLYYKYKNMGSLVGGFLLLAAGAWIKNEGLLYFTSAVLFFIFTNIADKYTYAEKDRYFSKIKKFFLITSIAALIFIVPWQFFRLILDISVRDFDINKLFTLAPAENLIVLKKSCLRFLSSMFIDIKHNCGIWYILLFSLILFRKHLIKKEIIFLLWLIVSLISVFIFSFVLSTRPLNWHFTAVPRLLLIPEVLSWYVIITSIKREKNRTS